MKKRERVKWKMYDEMKQEVEILLSRAKNHDERCIVALQIVMVTFFESHFPALANLARQKIAPLNDRDLLSKVFSDLYEVKDEDETALREMLEAITPKIC